MVYGIVRHVTREKKNVLNLLYLEPTTCAFAYNKKEKIKNSVTDGKKNRELQRIKRTKGVAAFLRIESGKKVSTYTTYKERRLGTRCTSTLIGTAA